MPDSPNPLEEGSDLEIDFKKLSKAAACGENLVPVAVQDVETGEVLIVAYANQEALDYTLKNGVAAFWSTSRNELWIKGASSGDTLEILEVRVNCEQNSLLYRVRLKGEGACHTKNPDGSSRLTCYYRRIEEGQLVKLELARKSSH